MKNNQDYDSLIESKVPVENKKRFEDEYTIIEELLISKKVKIYKVQSKKDRLTCRTMHRIQKSSFCNLNDDRIMAKEFELLSNLDHPNIIKLITFFTNDMNFNIISEYFKEGNLESKIEKHKIFSENQAKYVCRQLLNAIKYLNDNNLVHTDINPDIIYIKDIIKVNDEELYNVKILQFGSSSINIHKSNSSLNYMAPEIIKNKYHQTSDIWSIGVILYQMIFDDLPFKGYKEDEIINNIFKQKPNLMNKDASPYVKNLITKMLNKNPYKRISVSECLKHDWFSVKESKYKKSNNNISSIGASDNLKKFFVSHISGHSGEFIKENKIEEKINTNTKKKKLNKKEENEKESEKEKKINERKIFENSVNSDSIKEESSSIITESEESNESKESEDSNYSISYSSFSPGRSKSNSICIRPKNILSEFGKKYNFKKSNNKKKDKSDKRNDKNKNSLSPKKNKKSKNEKDNEDKKSKKLNKEKDKEKGNFIKLNYIGNDSNKKNNESIPEKKLEQLIKLNKKDIIKHISLKDNKLLMSITNNQGFRKSFSLSMLDDASDKSNGQKLSPLLIETMKYMKYQIQINYYKNKEEEKIDKIFNRIINTKIKKNIIKLTVTYDDLYIGYLCYIGQKRFCFDTYSDNKKIFTDLSKYINEDKKNGNIINTLYEKDEFIRILILFKEKYLEYRLQKSYQKLRKSSVNEIFNCLNEIGQKTEFNYYKKYFNEIINIMMKNKYKEIYLFYEFKNLILTSIKNIFIKEKENQKKEKEKQKKLKEKENNEKGKEKDKQNKKRKTNSFENPKNNGIKGIIRVVSKKENLLNQNNVFHIDIYDNNRSNIHIFNNNLISNDSS